MNTDLISIIVPVYNAEKYLNICIDSVLNQRYENIELILINDGSTDNSLNICLEYASIDNRIKVITQENSGVASARNKGIEVATGEYITFLDSDDFYDCDYLYEFYNSLENSDMVISRMRRVYENGDISNEDYFDCDKSEYYWPIINYYNIPCWRCLFKTSIIKNNNILFTLNCRTGEDQEFSFKYMFYTKSISYSERSIYNYYINRNSVMHQMDYRHFDAVDAILRVIEHFNVRKQEIDFKVINSLQYFYIPRILEFSILTVIGNNQKPKKVLDYLDEKQYYNLLNSCNKCNCIYSSLFLKLWYKSPIWCLRKYYIRKKLGKILRKLRILK